MRRGRWPVVPWLYRKGLQSVSSGEKGKGKYFELIFQPTDCELISVICREGGRSIHRGDVIESTGLGRPDGISHRLLREC